MNTVQSSQASASTSSEHWSYTDYTCWAKIDNQRKLYMLDKGKTRNLSNNQIDLLKRHCSYIRASCALYGYSRMYRQKAANEKIIQSLPKDKAELVKVICQAPYNIVINDEIRIMGRGCESNTIAQQFSDMDMKTKKQIMAEAIVLVYQQSIENIQSVKFVESYRLFKDIMAVTKIIFEIDLAIYLPEKMPTTFGSKGASIVSRLKNNLSFTQYMIAYNFFYARHLNEFISSQKTESLIYCHRGPTIDGNHGAILLLERSSNNLRITALNSTGGLTPEKTNTCEAFPKSKIDHHVKALLHMAILSSEEHQGLNFEFGFINDQSQRDKDNCHVWCCKMLRKIHTVGEFTGTVWRKKSKLKQEDLCYDAKESRLKWEETNFQVYYFPLPNRYCKPIQSLSQLEAMCKKSQQPETKTLLDQIRSRECGHSVTGEGLDLQAEMHNRHLQRTSIKYTALALISELGLLNEAMKQRIRSLSPYR